MPAVVAFPAELDEDRSDMERVWRRGASAAAAFALKRREADEEADEEAEDEAEDNDRDHDDEELGETEGPAVDGRSSAAAAARALILSRAGLEAAVVFTPALEVGRTAAGTAADDIGSAARSVTARSDVLEAEAAADSECAESRCSSGGAGRIGSSPSLALSLSGASCCNRGRGTAGCSRTLAASLTSVEERGGCCEGRRSSGGGCIGSSRSPDAVLLSPLCCFELLDSRAVLLDWKSVSNDTESEGAAAEWESIGAEAKEEEEEEAAAEHCSSDE
jgi:hypothetical protein